MLLNDEMRGRVKRCLCALQKSCELDEPMNCNGKTSSAYVSQSVWPSVRNLSHYFQSLICLNRSPYFGQDDKCYLPIFASRIKKFSPLNYIHGALGCLKHECELSETNQTLVVIFLC